MLAKVMLYTYTDRDGFVPPSEADEQLITGNGTTCTMLGEAVVNLPRRPAGSSKKRGNANGKDVSETAAVMQEHLLREDKFKVCIESDCPGVQHMYSGVPILHCTLRCQGYHTPAGQTVTACALSAVVLRVQSG